MRKFYGMVLIAILLGVFLVVLPSRAQFAFLENPIVGEKAPGFELADLRGIKQNFSRLSAGKNTIVFFWATWCPHCREQLTQLHEKAAQIQTEGIKVLLVDLGEDTKSVEAYLKKNSLEFPVLLDVEGSVSETYKVLGIPTFIFVDKTGVVRGVENYLPDDYLSYFLPEKKK